MDLPKRCPGHSDKKYLVLNIVRLGLNLLLLMFNLVIMIIYLIYSIVLTYIFSPSYLCRVCVYKVGDQYKSLEEYHQTMGKKFQKRLKTLFPFLLFDWFFPFLMGLVFIIIAWYQLGSIPSQIYDINNYFQVGFLFAVMICQILVTQTVLRRTTKYHCKLCKYRRYCPVAQNKWNVREERKEEDFRR